MDSLVVEVGRLRVGQKTKKVKERRKHRSGHSHESMANCTNHHVGSWVTLTTVGDQVWNGRVVDSDRRNIQHGCLTLDHLSRGDGREFIGWKRFFQRDIRSVTLMPDKPRPRNPEDYHFFPKEERMDTVVITDLAKLDSLIRSLQDVEEIGCHLSGAEGRYDRANYFLMNIRNVLIVIPLDNFKGEKEEKLLWERLGKEILANPGIVKIFFDACRVGDYVYHHHTIKLVNICDLKVTYEYLTGKFAMETVCRCQANMPSQVGAKKKTSKICSSLPKLWDEFLPEKVSFTDYRIMLLPSQLNESEKVTRKRLALEVKYLIKLKEAMMSQVLRPLGLVTDSQNQMVVNASDEDIRRLLSDVDD